MGFYAFGTASNKEELLNKIGMEENQPKSLADAIEGHMFVCLVDNGPFQAAAIVYNQGELEEFTRPDEKRPRKWFQVAIRDLIGVAPPAFKQELVKMGVLKDGA